MRGKHVSKCATLRGVAGVLFGKLLMNSLAVWEIFLLISFWWSSLTEYFIRPIYFCTNTYSMALVRLHYCTVFCFTFVKGAPPKLSMLILVAQLLRSLLVTVIVSQDCILCKSSRFLLSQGHLKCENHNEFLWGLH